MVATTQRCPTCDGPAPAGAHGSGRLCGECRPIYEGLLERARVAADTPGTCRKCKQDLRGSAALRVEGGLYCGRCRAAGEFLLRLAVREARRGARSARRGQSLPRWAVLTVLGLAAGASGGALAYTVSRWTEETDPRRRADVEIPKARGEAAEALARAAAAAGKDLRTYAAAKAAEETVLAARAEAGSEPAVAGAFEDLLARVRAAKRRAAPALAASLLAEAAASAARERFADAAAVLARFPAELGDTSAAARVAEARARYEARARCEEALRALRGSSGAARVQAIDRLLDSADARRCAFSATPRGRRLAAERRRLRAEAAARRVRAEALGNGARGRAKPKAPVAKRLAAAQRLEAQRRYERADALYRELLAEDPYSADAVLGRARVALGRERFLVFRRETQRAMRLAPRRATVLRAWLAWVEGEDPVPFLRQATPTEPRRRALRALLALGPPSRRDDDRVRLYARGLAPAAATAAWTEATRAAALASRALGLSAAASRVALLLFADPKARQAFWRRSGLRPTAAGVLRGTFAVAPPRADGATIRRAVGSALAGRADRAPGWLVAALPAALAGETGRSGASLADLERRSARQVLQSKVLLEAAVGFAARVRTEQGAAALGRYVLRRGRRPAEARRKLLSSGE